MMPNISFYGTGFGLGDYVRQDDGTVRVIQWFKVLFFPLIPMGAWLIKARGTSHLNLGAAFVDSKHFEVIERLSMPWGRVLRMYILAVLLMAVAVGPAVLSITYSKTQYPSSPPPGWLTGVMVAAAIWVVVVLGILDNREHSFYENGSE